MDDDAGGGVIGARTRAEVMAMVAKDIADKASTTSVRRYDKADMKQIAALLGEALLSLKEIDHA